jgi:hypothetical protein
MLLDDVQMGCAVLAATRLARGSEVTLAAIFRKGRDFPGDPCHATAY